MRSPRNPIPWSPEWYTLTLVNAARGPADATSQLEWHTAAAAVALGHSWDQLKRGYFAHVSPEGESVRARLKRKGIPWTAIGENLAMMSGSCVPSPANMRRSHNGLMASEGHRANILNPAFKYLGVGIAADGDTYVLTQVFLA